MTGGEREGPASIREWCIEWKLHDELTWGVLTDEAKAFYVAMYLSAFNAGEQKGLDRAAEALEQHVAGSGMYEHAAHPWRAAADNIRNYASRRQAELDAAVSQILERADEIDREEADKLRAIKAAAWTEGYDAMAGEQRRFMKTGVREWPPNPYEPPPPSKAEEG